MKSQYLNDVTTLVEPIKEAFPSWDGDVEEIVLEEELVPTTGEAENRYQVLTIWAHYMGTSKPVYNYTWPSDFKIEHNSL